MVDLLDIGILRRTEGPYCKMSNGSHLPILRLHPSVRLRIFFYLRDSPSARWFLWFVIHRNRDCGVVDRELLELLHASQAHAAFGAHVALTRGESEPSFELRSWTSDQCKALAKMARYQVVWARLSNRPRSEWYESLPIQNDSAPCACPIFEIVTIQPLISATADSDWNPVNCKANNPPAGTLRDMDEAGRRTGLPLVCKEAVWRSFYHAVTDNSPDLSADRTRVWDLDNIEAAFKLCRTVMIRLASRLPAIAHAVLRSEAQSIIAQRCQHQQQCLHYDWRVVWRVWIPSWGTADDMSKHDLAALTNDDDIAALLFGGPFHSAMGRVGVAVVRRALAAATAAAPLDTAGRARDAAQNECGPLPLYSQRELAIFCAKWLAMQKVIEAMDIVALALGTTEDAANILLSALAAMIATDPTRISDALWVSNGQDGALTNTAVKTDITTMEADSADVPNFVTKLNIKSQSRGARTAQRRQGSTVAKLTTVSSTASRASSASSRFSQRYVGGKDIYPQKTMVAFCRIIGVVRVWEPRQVRDDIRGYHPWRQAIEARGHTNPLVPGCPRLLPASPFDGDDDDGIGRVDSCEGAGGVRDTVDVLDSDHNRRPIFLLLCPQHRRQLSRAVNEIAETDESSGRVRTTTYARSALLSRRFFEDKSKRGRDRAEECGLCALEPSTQ